MKAVLSITYVKKPNSHRMQTTMLLTIYVKRQSSLWSISNIITWYTFVLAIVLRPLYVVDGVLIVITVFDDICIIQIEPVP